MADVLSIVALIGAVVLLSFYVRGSFRRTTDIHLMGLPATVPHFDVTLASLSDSHATRGMIVGFWGSIDEIQSARLQAIATAKTSIQFETFIMTPGRRAIAFKDSLCERASAGVDVHLLADSYGSQSIAASYWRELKQAGVEVRFFNPFSWRDPVSYLRRNHRKLLLIDQQLALIGGAGISDLWDGVNAKKEPIPWLDFEVQWQGELIGFLTGLFWQHWLDAGGLVNLNEHVPYRSAATIKNQQTFPVVVTPGEDPTPSDSSIRSLLQVCILSAQQRIWLASPYLLPDPTTCQILSNVCQAGIDIRILTMGPKTDKPYVYYVSRERYGPLLKSGIHIYEHQPSMMHAKVILVDRQWGSMGSANLDPRSFFHNDELNICSSDRSLISHIETFFESAFQRSQKIQLNEWRDRPLHERAFGQIVSPFYWQL